MVELNLVFDFLSNNWLGVITTITAIISILTFIFVVKTYRSQKPDLKITVAKCEHSYRKKNDTTKPRDIQFWARFHINKVGDRDTTIDAITLSFKVNENEYKIPEYNEQASIEEVIPIIVKNPTSDRKIIAHDIADIGAFFDTLFDEAEEKQIECKFTIHDTHRKYVVEGISKRVERFPIQGKPISRKEK